jgi:hypothetical protein
MHLYIKHEDELAAEAGAMNQYLRAIEAEKMRAVHMSLKGPNSAMFQEDALLKGGSALLVKYASGHPMTDMEKEALVGLIGAGVKALGGGLGQIGGGLAKGFTPTQRLSRAARMPEVAAFKPALGESVGGKIQALGSKVQQAGTNIQAHAGTPNSRFAAEAKRLGVSTSTPTGSVSAGPAAAVKAAVQPAASSAGAVGPAVAASPAVKAPSGSKPFMSFGTKAKIVGGLGLAGAAYGGAKAVGAAKDYMMQPTYSSQQWGQNVPLKQQPNAYGY